MSKDLYKDRGKDSCKRREVGLIIKANRLHTSAVEKNLDHLKMRRSQHMLLMLISRSPDDISQKELAEKLQITPAAVAITLKKLEQNGYISRQVDENDNRFNRTIILPKGKEIVCFSEESFVAVDKAMFDGITEEELSCFIQTMEKINNNLKAFCDDEESNGCCKRSK